ncbi:MAG: hypothetical protein IPP29_16425 [Bacteroidetes bacterium]|nr:hypothetical protein [Bacteroidota bacterium]
MFGLNNIYAEIGIDPQIYFVRKTTFINIDGNFGLRYQNFKKGNIFLHISYTPILYTTHHNDFYIPFCFGIGECF